MSRVICLLVAALLAVAVVACKTTPRSADGEGVAQPPDDLAVTRTEIIADASTNVPAEGAARADFPRGFPIGIGSDLAFKSVNADASIDFWAITDRGPNGEGPTYQSRSGRRTKTKIFPAPSFVPKIAVVRWDGRQAVMTRTIDLHHPDGPASGLPLTPGMTGSTGETPLSETFAVLPYNTRGLDPEGIDVDRTDGSLWVSDEYGPFILNIDPATGLIKKKLAPGAGLPDVFALRQPNRGFEALAVTASNKVVAGLQSIIDIDGKPKKSRAVIIRILVHDPATGANKMLAYPFDRHDYRRSRDCKLGGLHAISDTRFLAIEQGKNPGKTVINRLYLIDTADASDITGVTAPGGKHLESLSDIDAVIAAGVTPIRKTLLVNLNKLGWTAEKAEGIALLPDNQTIALIADNDFRLKTTVIHPLTEPDGKRQYDIEDYTLVESKGLHLGAEYGPETTIEINRGNEPHAFWLIELPEPLR